jgi:hypothetical protein
VREPRDKNYLSRIRLTEKGQGRPQPAGFEVFEEDPGAKAREEELEARDMKGIVTTFLTRMCVLSPP